MRGELEDAYNARGSKRAGLVHGFSLKMNSDVVIASKKLFINFLWVESEPCIAAASYQPTVPGLELSQIRGFDALILTTLGELRLRSVRTQGQVETTEQRANRELALARLRTFPQLSLGTYKKVTCETVSLGELIAGNEMRLRNWHRLLPWCAQARYHSLGHYRRLFASRLASRGEVQVRELLTFPESTEEKRALMLAAAIQAVAQGECRSDLNSVVFGKNTRFFLEGKQ
jgi:hypothetical protein